MTRPPVKWRPSRLFGVFGGHPTENGPEDAAAAVDEVSRLVLAFNQSPEDPTDDRLQALMAADAGCVGLLQDFRVECLQRPAAAADVELGWNSLDAAHRQFARAYEKFLMGHQDGAETSAATGQLGTIAARLLFHLATLAKLSIFRDQALDARLWHLAHHVYCYAEDAGVSDRVIALYNDPERVETTCQQVYGRLLVLATLNASGFSARQIDVVDNWLADWIASDLIFSESTPGQYRYQVDLASDSGPTRLLEGPRAESVRFLDTEAVCVQIERLRRALRSRALAAMPGSNGSHQSVDFVDLLDRLERIWSLGWCGQDQRNFRRERVDGVMLEVVRGLPGLCRAARRDTEGGASGQDGKALSATEEMDIKIYGFVTERTRQRLADTPGRDGDRERWRVFDRSANGYGTVMPATMGAGLRPGSLLGLRLLGGKRWGVGIAVRRVALRDSGEVFVGIEVLASSPVIVSVEPAARELAVASPLSIPAGRENSWALFLAGGSDQRLPDSLLIDNSMFSTARQFHLAARNVCYTIQMTRILAKGEGWQRVGFEVIAKRN
jgi:hypothetical protein